MMKIKLFAVLGAVFMAVSCTPTKVVVPLNEGQWQIGVTQGRPQINEGYLPVIGAYAAKEFLRLKRIMAVFNFLACFWARSN